MYCVKCGVKLKDGINVCPLCNTKMYYENKNNSQASYSNNIPKKGNPNLAFVSLFSLFLLIVCSIILIVCFNLYHRLAWGGYVLASIGVFYIIFIFPMWFIKASPLWFVGLDIVFIALLLMYICIKTNGKWFFSFALPIVMFVGTLFFTGIALRRQIKKAGFFIIGALLIATGLFCMLIEMLQSITFNTKMFTWSLYVVTSTTMIGLFLILCGLIKPLKESLTKRFFI